jgi:putative heme-binding domain-containing protein
MTTNLTAAALARTAGLAFGVLCVVCALVAPCAATERVPWTESRLFGSPEPPAPYVSEAVFTGIETENALELVAHGGRLFLVERGGRILSFAEGDPRDGSIGAELFADLKAERPGLTFAYGLAFHPRAAENRSLFVTYTLGNDLEDGTRLSRFRFSAEDPPRLLPETEEILLTWRSGGHNGAHLQFGPDGLLYVSTGDATAPSPPDGLRTGQDNSDLLAAILRLDVDGADVGLAYRVPSDNPWAGVEGVRPEIWAFGFRNPWKMAFHRDGRLWVGDVGWELWEMLHLVGRGGNHGWSAMEGPQPILPETASPLATITAPVVSHPHSEAASITGGYLYEGARLPGLRGAYVYGDYETGKIWALWHEDGRIARHEEIATTPHRIASFGLGGDGELYYLHYAVPGGIHRLVENPESGRADDFPRRLSETGLFRDTAAGDPAPGVYEYRIAEPMWEDGSVATRWIALPGQSAIATTLRERGAATVTWPEGAVLARTLRIGERPVETQTLHFDGRDWRAYAYRWDAEGRDAELVEAAGAEVAVDPAGWKGGPRHRIASRAECLRCHNSWSGFAIGFHPLQLSEFPALPGQPAREAALALGLADAAFFERERSGRLLRSEGPGPVETRARSWLHANCAHCHRRHGGGSAPLEVNYDRPLSEAALLWQPPTRGGFGLSSPRLVVPGEPWRSVLNYRVSAVGHAHMPSVGPREVDARGAALLWSWVAAMPREEAIAEEAVAAFDESLLATPSSAMRLAHAVARGNWEAEERRRAVEAGLASPRPEVRALFERFRPPGERPTPRRHDPEAILSLAGDPERGAALLSPVGRLAACFACHRLGGEGLAFGPDLDGVGARLDRRSLLEALLEPSKAVAPEWVLWNYELRSGETLSGFVLRREGEGVLLRIAPGTERVLSDAEVLSAQPGKLSAMPEGLVADLSAEELADVLARLGVAEEAAR